MVSRRFSLRLFMLVALLVALGTCVVGIRYQIAWAPEPDTKYWANFNSPEFSKHDNWGLYRGDENGHIDVVVLPNLNGLEALRKLKAEANVEMLAICSNDVFRAIDFTRFTNAKRIALTELTLPVGWADRLTTLPNLDYLCITEFTTDPTRMVRDLAKLPRLRHLVIRTNQLHSVEDFPALDRLETLLIKTSNLDDNELRKLQERMPRCKVSIFDGHYQRGLHDLDALSIET